MTGEDDVIFVRVLGSDRAEGPPAVLEGNEAETQAWRDTFRRKAVAVTEDLPVKVAELQNSLQEMTDRLAKVFAAQATPEEESARGFALESFTVGLAVNAAGKVALVAELGIEASIEVTFRRL